MNVVYNRVQTNYDGIGMQIVRRDPPTSPLNDHPPLVFPT